MQGASDRWTIDKRIPVSLIGVILAQTFGVAIWAAKIDSRVEQLEKNQVSATAVAITGERLILVQEKMSEMKAEIGAVKVQVTEVKGTVGDLKEEIRRTGFGGKR